MAVLQINSFECNGIPPKHLMGKNGTLNIDGINCVVSSFELIASARSITAYKAVIKADERQENIALYAYIKHDIQRLQSILIADCNPFSITSGDYVFRCLKVVLNYKEKSFEIEVEGIFSRNLNSDTILG